VEKVNFEPGIKQWMCDGGWEWWAGGRWTHTAVHKTNELLPLTRRVRPPNGGRLNELPFYC